MPAPATKVRATDDFWLKGQPCSLNNVFDGADIAALFVGGTVYLAFLSAISYHCSNARCYSENYF